MDEKVGLMYSGGVDSVVCLKLLVEQGIVPVIFHIKTAKLSRRHERMIKRNAKRLSPASPYYVFNADTLHYNASSDGFYFDYHVYLDEWAEKARAFHPLRYVDKLAVGYFGSMGGKRKHGEVGIPQERFIRWVKIYGLPYILPLADKSCREVNGMFAELPLEVQRDMVSSTRFYGHNGETVGKRRFMTRFGDYEYG